MNRSSSRNSSSCRAFTLIEMLITLSLLVVLMVVAISWVTSITKRQHRGVQEQRWYKAAYLVMDQIDRDLVTIDMLQEARQSRVPRVQIESDQLLIRTIDNGSSLAARYVFDSESGSLLRMTGASQKDLFPILGSIKHFDISIQRPEATHILPSLRVTLISASGQRLVRSFPLMREDVQR